MNRFFRTAYATTLVYLFMTLYVVSATGVSLSALCFACLYVGLFVLMLPDADVGLANKRVLFSALGIIITLLGFLPIVLARDSVTMHYQGYGLCLAAAIIFFFFLRHRTIYRSFEAIFSISAIITIGILAFVVIASTSISEFLPVPPGNVMHAFSDTLLILIVLLVTGFLLLRGLRAEESVVDRKSFYRQQFRDALIFVVIVAAILLLDPFRFLRGKLGLINIKIIKPFISFVERSVRKLISALSVKDNGEEYKIPDPPEEPDAVTITPAPTPEYEVPEAKPVTIDPKELELRSARAFRTITIIFLSVVALAIALIIIIGLIRTIKRLRERDDRKGIGYPNEVRKAVQDDEPKEKGPKLPRFSHDPRERIRRAYADFLRHLRRRRIKYRRTDTCGQIERRASGLIRSQADEIDEFTRIYEDARYCSTEEPTMEEADHAEKLLGEIRRGSR